MMEVVNIQSHKFTLGYVCEGGYRLCLLRMKDYILNLFRAVPWDEVLDWIKGRKWAVLQLCFPTGQLLQAPSLSGSSQMFVTGDYKTTDYKTFSFYPQDKRCKSDGTISETVQKYCK